MNVYVSYERTVLEILSLQGGCFLESRCRLSSVISCLHLLKLSWKLLPGFNGRFRGLTCLFPSFFFLHPEKLWYNWQRTLTGQSPNQQCQITERSSKHSPKPWNITRWLRRLLTDPLLNYQGKVYCCLHAGWPTWKVWRQLQLFLKRERQKTSR